MGGGIGMGNTCRPMAVSFQCMTKSTTIKKNNNKKQRKKKKMFYCPCSGGILPFDIIRIRKYLIEGRAERGN